MPVAHDLDIRVGGIERSRLQNEGELTRLQFTARG